MPNHRGWYHLWKRMTWYVIWFEKNMIWTWYVMSYHILFIIYHTLIWYVDGCLKSTGLDSFVCETSSLCVISSPCHMIFMIKSMSHDIHDQVHVTWYSWYHASVSCLVPIVSCYMLIGFDLYHVYPWYVQHRIAWCCIDMIYQQCPPVVLDADTYWYIILYHIWHDISRFMIYSRY